jgi:MFS family permease
MSVASSDSYVYQGSEPARRRLSTDRLLTVRLAAGAAVAAAGVEGAAVALAVAMFGLTGSAGWVSAVLLASLGLSALLSPLGGVIADRYPRRAVMVASCLAQVPVYALVAVTREPWALVALAGVAAAFQRPFDASLAASVPALVPEERRPRTTSAIAASQQTAMLLSPAAAGAAMAAAGQRATFAAVAALYAGAAAVAAGLPRRAASTPRRGHLRSNLREGIARLAGDRVLATITSATAVLAIFSSMTLVAGVALAERTFGAGESGYGLMVSAWGGGMIIGSLVAGVLAARGASLLVFAAGLGTAGFALGAVSGAPTMAVAIALLACGGIGNGLMYTTDQLLFQHRVPEALLGRVAGAAWSVLRAAQAVSFVVAGAVVELAGPRGVFALAGAGTLVALLPVAALLISRSGPGPAGRPVAHD